MKPIEKKLLEMWQIWIDGRTDGSEDDEPDRTPADVLEWFANHSDCFPGEERDGCSAELIAAMLDVLLQYGYEA